LEYNQALFAILRAKRKELADAAGLPPYVVFSDKTLVEMAAYFPQSLASMRNINGVGQVKLQQYGEMFVELVKSYCEEHAIAEKPKAGRRQKDSPSPLTPLPLGEGSLGMRTTLVAEAYNSG